MKIGIVGLAYVGLPLAIAFCEIVRALNDHAKAVRGSRIGVFGVSYKPGVGGTCASSRRSASSGSCASRARRSCTTTTSSSSWPEDVDCAVIVTAHPGLDLERVVRESPLVVDFRGVTRGIEATNLVRL